jgi:hypothetical protein
MNIKKPFLKTKSDNQKELNRSSNYSISIPAGVEFGFPFLI